MRAKFLISRLCTGLVQPRLTSAQPTNIPAYCIGQDSNRAGLAATCSTPLSFLPGQIKADGGDQGKFDNGMREMRKKGIQATTVSHAFKKEVTSATAEFVNLNTDPFYATACAPVKTSGRVSREQQGRGAQGRKPQLPRQESLHHRDEVLQMRSIGFLEEFLVTVQVWPAPDVMEFMGAKAGTSQGPSSCARPSRFF